MKQHPLILAQLILCSVFALVLNSNGCTTAPKEQIPSLSAIPGSGFVKQWDAQLSLSRGEQIDQIYVREAAVIAYTNKNVGYWLGASGGQMLGINQIAQVGYRVYPPVSLGDHIVVPTTITLESYDKTGKHVDSYQFPSAVQSPAAGAGNSLYLGVSHNPGGRLAKFNVGDKLERDWELTTGGIVAAPAVVNDGVYAGSVDGKVWAVTTERAAIWPTPGFVFTTYGAISGDLAADDFGVYVASQDHSLYCLDRNNGKLKWSYQAPATLIKGPIVIGNVVYQFVPDHGLVAINKVEGLLVRTAMWTQPQAQQILAADDKHLYVRFGANIIVALDPATGEPQFHSSRSDLTVFATNLQSPVIYAGTQYGTVVAIRPILKPGTVGEVVLQTRPGLSPLAMAR